MDLFYYAHTCDLFNYRKNKYKNHINGAVKINSDSKLY